MFKQWITRFVDSSEEQSLQGSADLTRVCAVLLVEIARADNTLAQPELDAMVAALKSSSELDKAELDQLIADCLAQADQAVSLHEHIRSVNENFSREQKIQLIEQMWKVAYADGNLDRYEEYTIRKISDLLYLKQREFVQAKLRVLG